MWRSFYALNEVSEMADSTFPDLSDLALPQLVEEQAEINATVCSETAVDDSTFNPTSGDQLPGVDGTGTVAAEESKILIDLTPAFEINDPRVSTAIGTVFELPVAYTAEEIKYMEVMLWEDLFPNTSENAEQAGAEISTSCEADDAADSLMKLLDA
ncbi:hypothetical protein KR093_010922 [Drosophila rubida]|uniref:Uncharacterized protein n=1 Tax=Drosophila rubida TaxID=30044 RepID=A0AAD4KBV5_9MUSC|nr:hypothetical protein KR093_010922 [Drosophila rubida]